MKQNYSKPRINVQNIAQSPKTNDLISLAKSLPKSVCKPSNSNNASVNQSLISSVHSTTPLNNSIIKAENRQIHNNKGYQGSSMSNTNKIGLNYNEDPLSDRKVDLTANRMPSQNTYFSGNYSQSTLNSGPSIPSQGPSYNTLKGINRGVGMLDLNTQYQTEQNPPRESQRHHKGVSSETNLRIVQSNFIKYNESSKNYDPRSDVNQSMPLNLKKINEINLKGNRQPGNQRVMISANSVKQFGSPQKFLPNNFFTGNAQLMQKQYNNLIGAGDQYRNSQFQTLPFEIKNANNIPVMPTYSPQNYDPYYNHPELNSSSYYGNNLPQHSVKYSEATMSSKMSTNSSKVDLNLNIEDLLIHEEKIIDIIEDLTSDPSNSCYELWNFYGISSVSGKFENFFKDESSKKIIFEHTSLEFISMIICYDCQKHGIFPKFEKEFTQIFNYIHQNFLLFADYLLTKISKSCLSNVWVNKLRSLVKSSLKLAPNNKNENVRVILYHNENISNILKGILKEHTGTESYLDMLFNFLFNTQTVSLLILSDIFRNKVLKFSVRNIKLIKTCRMLMVQCWLRH